MFAAAPYIGFLAPVAALSVGLPFIIGGAVFSAVAIALSYQAISENKTNSELKNKMKAQEQTISGQKTQLAKKEAEVKAKEEENSKLKNKVEAQEEENSKLKDQVRTQKQKSSEQKTQLAEKIKDRRRQIKSGNC